MSKLIQNDGILTHPIPRVYVEMWGGSLNN